MSILSSTTRITASLSDVAAFKSMPVALRKVHYVRRIPGFRITPISGAIEPEEPVRNAIVDGAANPHDIPLVEKVALREESFDRLS